MQPLQNRAVKIVEKLNGYVSTKDMEELHSALNLNLLKDWRKMSSRVVLSPGVKIQINS